MNTQEVSSTLFCNKRIIKIIYKNPFFSGVHLKNLAFVNAIQQAPILIQNAQNNDVFDQGINVNNTICIAKPLLIPENMQKNLIANSSKNENLKGNLIKHFFNDKFIFKV